MCSLLVLALREQEVCYFPSIWLHPVAEPILRQNQGSPSQSAFLVLATPELKDEGSPAPPPRGCPDHGTGEVEPVSALPSASDYHTSGTAAAAEIPDSCRPPGRCVHFRRIGRYRHWHMDLKQVKRHRDSHFPRRYRWACPNEMDTRPSPGGGLSASRRSQHALRKESLAC